MSKHHSDKHGTYDLSMVHAITPAIERNKENEIKSKKAVLHFPGGSQLATNTDYDALVKQWKGGEDVAKPAAVVPQKTDDDSED